MQYLDQLEEQLRNAVFENVGNLIAFRVGPESARILSRELEPEFSEADLMNLPRYHVYLIQCKDFEFPHNLKALVVPLLAIRNARPSGLAYSALFHPAALDKGLGGLVSASRLPRWRLLGLG
jgi:hypothetical protein